MGWDEADDEDYVITEDELREFQKLKQVGAPSERGGPLPASCRRNSSRVHGTVSGLPPRSVSTSSVSPLLPCCCRMYRLHTLNTCHVNSNRPRFDGTVTMELGR